VQLQNKLTGNQAIDRIRALRLILALELAEHFKREIFSITNDPTPEVRATAIRALGRIGDLTSHRILERALAQDTPLVQTQALEALEQMGGIKETSLFIPLLKSPDANVRAAAVRILLKMRVPEAASSLVAMMQDARIEHRCMALWVVDQYRLAAIAPRLRDMVKNDPDPRIARTAQQVLRRIERGNVEVSSASGIHSQARGVES
jgi:HEAT repeat protein